MAATKTKTNCEVPPAKEFKNIPTTEFPAKAEDIHIKTSKSSLNSDLVMRQILGIDKTQQTIQNELENYPALIDT